MIRSINSGSEWTKLERPGTPAQFTSRPIARMAPDDPRGDLVDRLAVRDVADLPLGAELLRGRAQALLPAREQDAPPPASGQQARSRGADAARAAGQNGNAHAAQSRARQNDVRGQARARTDHGQWGGARIDDDPRDREVGDVVARGPRGQPARRPAAALPGPELPADRGELHRVAGRSAALDAEAQPDRRGDGPARASTRRGSARRSWRRRPTTSPPAGSGSPGAGASTPSTS